MPKILSYIQEASLFPRLFVVTQQKYQQLFAQSTLQKSDYSAKQPKQYLKVHSDYLNIQKSFEKQSKAFKIYSTSLLLPISQGHYLSFFNFIPAV